MIDHERFDRPFRRFEFQAELFLEHSEYRSLSGRMPGAAIGEHPSAEGGKPGSLSRKLDTNIESACDSGLVEYRAA